jgi:hypothetical protein
MVTTMAEMKAASSAEETVDMLTETMMDRLSDDVMAEERMMDSLSAYLMAA